MEFLILKCNSCGKEQIRSKYFTFTGHRHGEGWEYVCDNCRGPVTMRLFDLSTVPLLATGMALDGRMSVTTAEGI